MEAGLACPSAQPDSPGAVVFGVATPTPSGRRVVMLPASVPLEAVAGSVPAGIPLPEILRLSAPCAEGRCRHFGGERCTLAERITARLAPVQEKLARCAIRPSCRWWAEHGAEACRRCPQIVTEPFQASDLLREVAAPPVACS
jgi:hypothetical protein